MSTSLGEQLLKVSENVISKIQDLLITFTNLIDEIDSYQAKKKAAKTVGTSIGVAGAFLAPFTFGLSLVVAAAGAGVNITTELIDKSQTEEFEKRIQTHLKSFNASINELKSVQEKVEVAFLNAIENGVRDSSIACLLALWSRDSNHANVLKTLLTTSVLIGASKFAVKSAGLNASSICGALGIQMTSSIGAKTIAMPVAQGGLRMTGRVVTAGLLGGVVAVYDVVSLSKDLAKDHDAIVKTRQVMGELMDTERQMVDYTDSIKNLKEQMELIEREQA